MRHGNNWQHLMFLKHLAGERHWPPACYLTHCLTVLSIPRPALRYLWIILGCGAVAAGAAVAQWTPAAWPTTAACLALGIWASLFKIKLPGVHGTVSPGFVVVLVAAANTSWPETVAVSVVCALVQTMWRAATRPDWMRISFNLATMAIATTAAYAVSRLAGGDHLIKVAMAGLTLQIVNTLIVSTLLCLIRNTPLLGVWRSIQVATLPYYFAGGILAGLWSRPDSSLAAAFCLAVSLCLMDLVFREHIRRRGPALEKG